jgi:hypothetical protein
MERVIFGGVAVAFMMLGVGLLFWPAWFIRHDREQDNVPRPPTPGDIWRMRMVGIFLIAGGGYGLYCILAGVPGAEFFPV